MQNREAHRDHTPSKTMELQICITSCRAGYKSGKPRYVQARSRTYHELGSNVSLFLRGSTRLSSPASQAPVFLFFNTVL